MSAAAAAGERVVLVNFKDLVAMSMDQMGIKPGKLNYKKKLEIIRF